MSIVLAKVFYTKLNARQKESYNFQKISAVLADYGFFTIRLSDDWQGADFIAQHIDGETFLKVQLKGRPTFGKKYIGKNIYIGFFDGDDWYLYPHDTLLDLVLSNTNVSNTSSWIDLGGYSFPSLSREIRLWFEPFKLIGDVKPIE
jgi:hypothetical protein